MCPSLISSGQRDIFLQILGAAHRQRHYREVNRINAWRTSLKYLKLRKQMRVKQICAWRVSEKPLGGEIIWKGVGHCISAMLSAEEIKFVLS